MIGIISYNYIGDKMKKIIHIIILILWLLVIFSFSNEAGGESTEKSDFFTIKIVDKSSEHYQGFTKVVRKIAHLSEFAILTFLVYLVVNDYPFKNKYIITLLFSLLCSTLDEIHQIFIPLRSGSFIDVTIDWLSILITVCLIIIRTKKETN